MKLIGEKIIVRCQPGSELSPSAPASSYFRLAREQPTALYWRGRLYRVQQVQGHWRWRCAWWTTPCLLGRERLYYRVLCTTPAGPEATLEIYRESRQWTLSRMLD